MCSHIMGDWQIRMTFEVPFQFLVWLIGVQKNLKCWKWHNFQALCKLEIRLYVAHLVFTEI